MDNAHAKHVVTPVSTYVTIFVTLLIFTGITYWVAQHDYGMMNTPVALSIAVFKASLVVIYFMGVRYNTPLTKVVVVAGFFWLLIMFSITMADFLTRGWIAGSLR